ncbi:MAG: hypothetical protein OEM52_10110 [bacterium]|nr:hypothetical protein [bacterium]
MDMLGTWIAAIFTLILFSFLYRDNPVYKLAEYIFVGLSTGYTIAVQWHSVLKPNVIDKIGGGDLLPIVPGLLGIILLLRLIPNLQWVARYPIALYIGVGAALNMIQFTQGQLIPQLQGTMLVPYNATNILIIVGTLTSLSYFFFALEHKALVQTSKIGIAFLMVSFGAAYGTTVMGRISLLISRIDFLISDWLMQIF